MSVKLGRMYELREALQKTKLMVVLPRAAFPIDILDMTWLAKVLNEH